MIVAGGRGQGDVVTRIDRGRACAEVNRGGLSGQAGGNVNRVLRGLAGVVLGDHPEVIGRAAEVGCGGRVDLDPGRRVIRVGVAGQLRGSL